MTDMPSTSNVPTDDEYADTLIVPPPNFKERFQAAQKARRSGEIRQSVEIPNPLTKANNEGASTQETPAETKSQEP